MPTVRQIATLTALNEDGDSVVTFVSAVAAGSTLVVIGTGVANGGQEVRLQSVSDGTNTWAGVSNLRSPDTYLPNQFSAYAPNAASGSPSITLSWSPSAENRIAAVVMELTSVPTTAVADASVSGISSAGALSTSTTATATLSGTGYMAVLCAGGYFGAPTNPSGWTSALNVPNGSLGGVVGCQVSYKDLSTTSPVTGSVDHEAVSLGGGAVMLVIKASTAAAYRYKFTFDPAKMTSGDTSITGYVWRNTGPDGGLAEKYTSLVGASTAGTLYVTAVPAGVALTDTVQGVFGNGTDTSGLVSGTVENA